MTKAWFLQKGNHFKVTIEGHSCYIPAEGLKANGDIVCSACSVLAYAFLQCVLAEEEDGGIYGVSSTIDEGSFRLEFWCSKPKQEKIEHLVEFSSAGYRLLKESYPQNVEIYVHKGEKSNHRT